MQNKKVEVAEIKKYRCPKCGFEMKIAGEFHLWCFQLDAETLASGHLCPKCVMTALKEKFPTMVHVVEERKEDNEL